MRPILNKTVHATFLAAALLALMTGGTGKAVAGEETVGRSYEGAPVTIGNGTARVVVRCDAKGSPLSVGVMLSSGALSGLPEAANSQTSEGQWEYRLPMPSKGPKTGYAQVMVDWNPQGHPPPHVYTVPHFDFHFYMMSSQQVQQVSFTGPGDAAAEVADASLVPSGYKVVPETAINKMGVHAVDLAAPEFRGKPFTATFIYGYYKGRLTFVEPMVTLAFLRSRPAFVQPVSAPARYSTPGYYPHSYEVQYDASGQSLWIALGGLKHWEGAASTTAKK